MKYTVVVDPEIEISAEEFIKAWNESPYSEHATAQGESAGTLESYMSPDMAAVLVTAAVGIPAAIITSFVNEYLKKKFIDKTPKPKKKITTTTIQKPDGTPLLIIRQEEEA